MAWLMENLHVFWPLAQRGYQEVGRGAIVVDTTDLVAHTGGMGHPMGYLDQETIAQQGDEDTQRMVGEYDPAGEFVSMLLKPQDGKARIGCGLFPENLAGNHRRREAFHTSVVAFITYVLAAPCAELS